MTVGEGEIARAADWLRSSRAIRQRSAALLASARAGRSRWFAIDDRALAPAAGVVADVTRRRYPDLRVPYHSRWRHFETGGVDRVAELDALDAAGSNDAHERARCRIDLAVVSVLLDAGAGPVWRFREPETGLTVGRSEGLGIASLRAFAQGLFSSAPDRPQRVDAAALARLDEATLARAFQAGAGNPLVGLQGRVDLLHRLSRALASQPQWFGASGRPGHLFDALVGRALAPTAGHSPDRISGNGSGNASGNSSSNGTGRTSIRAHDILRALLESLGGIWPHGATLVDAGGVQHAIGDCWRHPGAGGDGPAAGWVPLHKLSQWLTYSLLEPFESAGVAVTGLDELTALAEYRNGGLMLDSGVLVPHDPKLLAGAHRPGDELVVEWRALTVSLVDELAPRVRDALGLREAQLPLAAVLEGGTWAAGRELAAQRRGGEPPLSIVSDGTVF